jgi:hypothetical protein
MFGNNALKPRTSIASMLPKPTSSGVIGPPKVKMPKVGGDSMPHMSSQMPKSSLSPKLSTLPQFPTMPTQPTSLFHSKGGFGGVRKP